MWPFNSKHSSRHLDPDVVDTFVRMHSGDVSTEDEEFFKIWCKTHPHKVASFSELELFWYELKQYETDAVRKKFVNSDTTGNNPDPQKGRFQLSWPGRPGLVWVSSLILLIGIFVLFVGSALTDRSREYSTDRGERLVINLDDGSTIYLNSLSRMTVKFNTQQRLVVLTRGEALFNVAGDPTRPFTVRTTAGEVEAIGTRFNVNIAEDRLAVTVVEGTVSVKAAIHNNTETSAMKIATSGDQVVLQRSGATLINKKPKDLDPVIAWSYGKLIFSGEPLQEALEEINRHSKHTIAIKDPILNDLHIYGIFNAGDTSGFLSAIGKVYPIKAVSVSGENITFLYLDNPDS